MIFLPFPSELYPACAPLPVPFANHALSQEANQYRHRPKQRPSDEELIERVLARIARARSIVFEYLDPFVRAEQEKREDVPNPRTKDFLRETLAPYNPTRQPYAKETVKFWTRKGLLRRPSGELLDIQSVAAVFVARIIERDLERAWLPSHMNADEPPWYYYARSSPKEDVQTLAMPYIPSNAATLLYTPWRGALWEDAAWERHGKRYVLRWSGDPSLDDLHMWKSDGSLRKETDQFVSLEEARSIVLGHQAKYQKGDPYESRRLYP